MKHDESSKKSMSIQKSIFRRFFAILLFCSFMVAGLSYSISTGILRKRIVTSFSETVNYIGSNISAEVSYIERMMNYFFVDADVKGILSMKGLSDYERLKISERIENAIKNNLLIATFDYVNEVKLFDFEEAVYTFTYSIERGRLDETAIINLEQFQKLLDGESDLVFVQDEDCLLPAFRGGPYPPLLALRAIKNPTYSQTIGIVVLLINGEIFRKHLYNEAFSKDMELAVLDSDGSLLFGSERILEDVERSNASLIQYPINDTGWFLVASTRPLLLTEDIKVVIILSLAVVFSSLLFSFFMWKKLKKEIIIPINEVSVGMNMVVENNLVVVPESSAKGGEVAVLVENYNHMVCQLQQLIQQNINEALARKEMEYQALQMQINPHFVYNSLNTIRWMAIIHQADNIKEFSEKLSRLLRTITHNFGKPCTLRDELECIKDYLFIEQIAYGFHFTSEIECEDDSLLDIACLNFFLQPIIENSILHGLGTKEDPGYLKVTVSAARFNDEDVVEISIFDNGVGMDVSIGEGRRFTGIGLGNVSERLRRTYGPQYDLEVQSSLGEFTEVIIRIPRTVKETRI